MGYTKHPKIKPLQRAKHIEPVADDKPYYSRPASACDIWTDGEHIVLGFPPNAEHVRGHTVKIPLANCQIDANAFGGVPAKHTGWKALSDCLRARADAQRHVTIAKAGAITGYQLEAILKNMSPVKYGSDNKRITSLADLGLD